MLTLIKGTARLDIFQPSIEKIASHPILYGYRDGEFFEEPVESAEAYTKAIETFE